MKSRNRISLAVLFSLGCGSPLFLAGCTPTLQGDGTPPPVQIGPGTLNVADAAIAGGDPSMALSVSQSVLASDPHNVDAMVHEGDAYYALNRCIPAQAAYQMALTNDSKSTAAETGLGRCLLKTDPKSAEQALMAAVQDDPGNAAAYNDLGIARDLQGNFAGAVDPYQHALNADPSLTAAEVNLGLSLALSGNGAEALQYLGPLATGPGATPKIREDYAAALVASGRDTEARSVLAIDLTQDQVNAAMDGFSAVIAGSQAPLDAAATPPAPTTAPAVQTASIAATPLPGSPPPARMPAASPPDTSTAAYVPNNSNAAYTGPSPLPVTASSSTPDPNAPAAPPSAAAQDFAAATTGKPMPVPPAAPMAAASTGSYKVQLASLNSQSDAQAEWTKLSGAMPALFGDKQPDVETAVVNGHTYYRLRTGSFDSKADAAKFCGEVSAGGSACTLANF
jgi:Tfp pilus assembly protein PilF/cell division septation protein DedD